MIEKYYKQAIEDAIASLKDDGVIIIPTDTVYGLAALSSSKVAVERIFEIKNRDKSKLLPVIVNSYKMLKTVVEIDDETINKISSFFPGAVTIVAKRNQNFDYYNADTVAVRMIDSPLVNELIDHVNEPLALTSANISTQGNVVNPMDLLDMFDGCIDCIFLDGKSKGYESTMIRISDNGELSLLREGKVSFEKILKEYNNA